MIQTTGISAEKALGDIVKLKTSSKTHFGDELAPALDDSQKSFADLMMDGINDVNDKQNLFEDLSAKAVIDPDSVDAHDVTIALAESTMSLNIAKNVIDRVLRAYQTITTLR